MNDEKNASQGTTMTIQHRLTGGSTTLGAPTDNALQFQRKNPEVQQRRGNFGQVGIGTLVGQYITPFAYGTFSGGSLLYLQSYVNFAPPHQGQPVFGIPYVYLIQGTTNTTAFQIWPQRGTSVTVGRYRVDAAMAGAAWDGTQAIWQGQIVDTTGTSSTVVGLSVDWQYINYTFGTLSGTTLVY